MFCHEFDGCPWFSLAVGVGVGGQNTGPMHRSGCRPAYGRCHSLNLDDIAQSEISGWGQKASP